MTQMNLSTKQKQSYRHRKQIRGCEERGLEGLGEAQAWALDAPLAQQHFLGGC